MIHGGNGDDVIHGNRGDDTLIGGDGNDRMFGYAHNDTIDGGAGDDRLHGNFGDDVIDGGEGADRIFGYGDADTLNGGPGNDLISGNFGDDIINGGADDDTLFGADGDDIVNGNSGNDAVNGNSLNDTLTGGPGNDTLDGGINNDSCSGGPGCGYRNPMRDRNRHPVTGCETGSTLTLQPRWLEEQHGLHALGGAVPLRAAEHMRMRAAAMSPVEAAPWISPKPLAESVVAIVSTAGLHRRSDPPFKAGAVDYRVIPGDVDFADLCAQPCQHQLRSQCFPTGSQHLVPTRPVARDVRRR
ncbi:Leukotoxin [Nymphon striatum]|nr:Leukotoxin [Nymphon striatum]